MSEPNNIEMDLHFLRDKLGFCWENHPTRKEKNMSSFDPKRSWVQAVIDFFY